MICISIENYRLRPCPVNNKMTEQFPKYPSTSLTHISLVCPCTSYQISNFCWHREFLWMQIFFRSANSDLYLPMMSFNWPDLTNTPHLDTTARVILSSRSLPCIVCHVTALQCSLVRLMSEYSPANLRRHKNHRLENKGFWAWILNFVRIFRQFWCTLDRLLYVFAWQAGISPITRRLSWNHPTQTQEQRNRVETSKIHEDWWILPVPLLLLYFCHQLDKNSECTT